VEGLRHFLGAVGHQRLLTAGTLARLRGPRERNGGLPSGRSSEEPRAILARHRKVRDDDVRVGDDANRLARVRDGRYHGAMKPQHRREDFTAVVMVFDKNDPGANERFAHRSAFSGVAWK